MQPNHALRTVTSEDRRLPQFGPVSAWFAVVATAVVAGILGAASPAAAAPSDFEEIKPGYYVEQVTNNPDQVADIFQAEGGDARRYGLSKPTQLTFNSDGVSFVAEKEGRVRVIIDGELQRERVLDISDRVATYIDRGMNGIAVKGDWLYIAYTHESNVTPYDGSKTARISKFRLAKVDGKFKADPASEIILVGSQDSTEEFNSCVDRPATADCIATDSGSHSVGNLNFGPDGYLYAAVGDGAGFYNVDPQALNAQVNESLSGKILRVTPDGAAAPGNPYFNGGAASDDNISKVWVKGLRNPTFFNFHPQTNELFVGNVGWYQTEAAYEVNKGDNIGWPCVENGEVSTSGYQKLLGCPLNEDVLEPIIQYPHELRTLGGEENLVGAITGVAVPTADEYTDDIKGSVVYPDYVLGFLRAARLNGDGSTAASATLVGMGAEGTVGLRTDSDGFLYFMVHEQGRVDGLPIGTLYRLRYNDDPNNPVQPVPSFRALPSAAGTLAREFDASSSYDPAGRTITYSWSFGDGQTATGATANHTFSEPGSYTVELTMRADDATSKVSRLIKIVAAPENIAFPVVTSSKIFGSTELNGSGKYEFAPSTEIPIEFSIRNQSAEVPFFVVVNVRKGNERAHRIEVHDQLLGTDEAENYAFTWSTAEPGDYVVDIEFYDEATYQDLEGRYPAAAGFVVTTRAGDQVDPDEPLNPAESATCVDEGDGNSWGVNVLTNSGCWLTPEPDLTVCTDVGQSRLRCPDGKLYNADGSLFSAEPTEPTESVSPGEAVEPVVCADEGDGNSWGVNVLTNSGCWLTPEPDLAVCRPLQDGQLLCPDGETYDPIA